MSENFEIKLPERQVSSVCLPNSSCSDLRAVRDAHDVRVRDMLDQVMEYGKEHPGVIKNIRLRERTLGVFMPDNGDHFLDELEKLGSCQVQVLRNVCGGDITAAFLKESTIDINIADAE